VILTLKWVPVHYNFLEMCLIYGIMTELYVLCEEGWLLLPGSVMESVNVVDVHYTGLLRIKEIDAFNVL
jgi:hypothetical protein